MRSGSVLVLSLALCATGCSKTADPGPAPTDTPVPDDPTEAAPTETPMPTTAAVVTQGAELAVPAPSSTQVAPIVPDNPRALGTEPFWNARIDGGVLTYATPENQKGRRIPVERRDTAIGAVFSGQLDGEPLVLTLAKRICNDGMSDRTYSLSAVLAIGSQRRVGCAS